MRELISSRQHLILSLRNSAYSVMFSLTGMFEAHNLASFREPLQTLKPTARHIDVDFTF
jgi:hypothetical protein